MTELIVGIVLDILGHVAIKNREGIRVERVPTSGLGVAGCRLANAKSCLLGSSEFPVLFPEIAFENFGRGQETQDCSIASFKPAASLLLASAIAAWAFVVNSALAGSNVAPAMPKPFKKERRPTSRRPRESRFPSAEGIISISLDAFRPLFRSFFIWYAARFSGCFSFHEIAVTALFGCNIYTRTPSILFHRYGKEFSYFAHGGHRRRSARVLTTGHRLGAFAYAGKASPP